jgi:hypothetical protein
MSWSLTATTQDIADSLITLKGNYKTSLLAFQAIKYQLVGWLSTAVTTPDLLQVLYALYTEVKHGFPDLDTGALPKMVDDEYSISPLIDTRNGFVCHLILDHCFSQTRREIHDKLFIFLAYREKVFPPTSYFGSRIKSLMCPNYAWHI